MRTDKHVPACFGDSRVETIHILRFSVNIGKNSTVYVCPTGEMMVKK